MDYEQIIYEVADGIATITFNRPEKLNAHTTRSANETLDALDRIDADDAVRAVIFTGAGRAFCAGADISGGADTFSRPASRHVTDAGVIRDGGGLVSLRLFALRKPVIAAINGAAVGVGVTMTLPMDIRIASTEARFGFVFARRGVVPEACSTYFLPRVVGMSKAAEWCYSGRVFGADEALAAGLVRSVHAPDELLPAARALAHSLVDDSSSVSIALIKQMLWRGLDASHPMEAHRAESRGMQVRGRSADSREGVASFLEKRKAVYPDRVSDGLPDLFPDWVEPEFS